MGHCECKFQGEGGSSTNEFWRQKTRVPGLSRGAVCMILRLAVLIQYRHVTHRQTHTQRDRHTILAITPTGKNACFVHCFLWFHNQLRRVTYANLMHSNLFSSVDTTAGICNSICSCFFYMSPRCQWQISVSVKARVVNGYSISENM